MSCETWLRPPPLSTISVLVGLPFTTNVPVMPAPMFAMPRPTRSTFSSKLSPYFMAYARDVAALWARITMTSEITVGSSATTFAEVMTSVGRLSEGRPPGTVPRTVTPRAWRSNR